jgi:hypothetical protein
LGLSAHTGKKIFATNFNCFFFFFFSSRDDDDDDDDSFTTIATDNLLSREKQEIFLSFYQELQTK